MKASCIRCKHFYREGIAECQAYPRGIPIAILSSQVIHDKPFKGDKGIQFEPIEKEEKFGRETE